MLKGKHRLSLIHVEGFVQSVVFGDLGSRLRGIFRLDLRNTGLLS